MEVGQAVLALNLVNAQLNFSERLFLILVEIGEGDFDNTALQRVVGVFWIFEISLKTWQPIEPYKRTQSL